jgi:hypothetical protein
MITPRGDPKVASRPHTRREHRPFFLRRRFAVPRVAGDLARGMIRHHDTMQHTLLITFSFHAAYCAG